MTGYTNYPKAPYLTDNNTDIDLSKYDFVVASILDGLIDSLKFNIWVDKAYRANKPILGVVRIDPNYYNKNTLGVWIPPENDKVFKLLKKRLIAPDGRTKYKVDAVLIDMRSYYSGNQLLGGNWVTGVAEHVRDYVKSLGFKTFLLTDINSLNLYPNSNENPGVMLTNEKFPVAVYQKGNIGITQLKIPWANSAFLWWYGSEIINGVLTPMFVSLVTQDKLNQILGVVTTSEPVVIPPVVSEISDDIISKLDLIISKLDVIINNIKYGG
jgi:hypothetical protein